MTFNVEKFEHNTKNNATNRQENTLYCGVITKKRYNVATPTKKSTFSSRGQPPMTIFIYSRNKEVYAFSYCHPKVNHTTQPLYFQQQQKIWCNSRPISGKCWWFGKQIKSRGKLTPNLIFSYYPFFFFFFTKEWRVRKRQKGWRVVGKPPLNE